MPFVNVNGARLHYTDTGGEGEVIVFSHGLLMSGEMFRAQIDHFSDRYRCIAYDHRGQGQSEVPRGRYDIDSLTEDAAALIGALGIGPVHFVGLSMGGFVGMRLASRQPQLLRSLTLLDTSAEPEPNAKAYRKLVFFTRWLGLWAVVDKVMPILFGETFMHDPSRADERAKWRDRIKRSDRTGAVRAATGVIDRAGVADELAAITVPTLVAVGEEDVGTVPVKSERIAAGIKGARLATIAKAGHSPTIEEPGVVNSLIDGFLENPV